MLRYGALSRNQIADRSSLLITSAILRNPRCSQDDEAETSRVLARAYKASGDDNASAIEGNWRSQEIIIEKTEAACCGLEVCREGRY